MRQDIDKGGNLVRKFEAGDGMRRRFYPLLESIRFRYPRRNATRHALSWYCDGHLARRPTYGIYEAAVLAEHLLAMARTGRARAVPDFTDAARFFAHTRRTMMNAITNHGVSKDLSRKGRKWARTAYSKLCTEGTALLRKIGLLTPSTDI